MNRENKLISNIPTILLKHLKMKCDFGNSECEPKYKLVTKVIYLSSYASRIQWSDKMRVVWLQDNSFFDYERLRKFNIFYSKFRW